LPLALMAAEEKLPPNYAKLDTALRSIGYSFEVAVADLIDNSIDARARHVVIRFVLRKNAMLDLVIYDDGHGMDETTLREAMRFGADVNEQIHRLGKFGLGLKLASLSQAREVRVYSQKAGQVSGRGWLEDSITRGFTSSIFDGNECREQLQELRLEQQLRRPGTVVVWSRLYRIGHHYSAPEEQVQRLINRLKNYLSLAFHRFLSGSAWRIRITIDALDAGSGKVGIPVAIDALNPFGYSTSGNKDFPQQLLLDGYDEEIRMIAHIWPPNSKQPEYKLPGGANARQGFYFYRNDRLIQGGGWNGLRETEPHSSLARIEVDVSPQFDLELSLDIKKIEVQLPGLLVKAIQNAKTRLGVDFKKYLKWAEQAYRTKSVPHTELPLTLGQGIPKMLQSRIVRELGLKKSARVRKLKFEWCDLDEDYLFDLDRERDAILLNRQYRRSLLHGLSGSSTDVPVTKCLLFLLLREVFYSERLSSRAREKLDQANRILLAAIKYERT
jgi:histidine kinase/DNA gyrase B/HSP90-like ATPase